MKILEEHEKFEILVLDSFRRSRFLDRLVFGGGTMLRLCHQLPRFSIDLDFYLRKDIEDFSDDFKAIGPVFEKNGWEITDSAEKHFTWLLEIRSNISKRRLKLEIRKDPSRAVDREVVIAFSQYNPDIQVRLTACSLKQMWRNKMDALLGRAEIRDAYDLEFLLRRGAGDPRSIDRAEIVMALEILGRFTKADFRSKLGALLPGEERERLAPGRFTLLEGALRQASVLQT